MKEEVVICENINNMKWRSNENEENEMKMNNSM